MKGKINRGREKIQISFFGESDCCSRREQEEQVIKNNEQKLAVSEIIIGVIRDHAKHRIGQAQTSVSPFVVNMSHSMQTYRKY